MSFFLNVIHRITILFMLLIWETMLFAFQIVWDLLHRRTDKFGDTFAMYGRSLSSLLARFFF